MPKLKTIIWFLIRPKYYPQIFQILKRSRNPKKENTRDESTKWCKQNCISQSKALKILIGNEEFSTLEKIFPEIMKKAYKKAENAPVTMGGEGAISLIYHLVKSSKPQKILETGVAYGWSALAILLAIKENAHSRLISNDMPYVNMHNEEYVGVVIPRELRNQWELQRLPDITGIPLALRKFGQSLDFAHYDSDKSYTARSWATPVLWEALTGGGIMMIDDINDNLAFKEFCENRKLQQIIIEHKGKFVGILKKQ